MTAIKYVFAKDAAGLEKIQASAIKSVTKARVQVQIAAVATIRHAFEHGDWTYAQRLVDGLGNTVNGAALVEWFAKYGGLTIEDGKGFSGWKGKDHIEANFNEAKAEMWWDLKKKNPYAGFSLEAALQKVIKDHTAAQAKLASLSEEDKAKVQLTVNDATIQAVLKLCNFDVIINDEPVEEQQALAA